MAYLQVKICRRIIDIELKWKEKRNCSCVLKKWNKQYKTIPMFTYICMHCSDYFMCSWFLTLDYTTQLRVSCTPHNYLFIYFYFNVLKNNIYYLCIDYNMLFQKIWSEIMWYFPMIFKKKKNVSHTRNDIRVYWKA